MRGERQGVHGEKARLQLKWDAQQPVQAGSPSEDSLARTPKERFFCRGSVPGSREVMVGRKPDRHAHHISLVVSGDARIRLCVSASGSRFSGGARPLLPAWDELKAKVKYILCHYRACLRLCLRNGRDIGDQREPDCDGDWMEIRGCAMTHIHEACTRRTTDVNLLIQCGHD